MTTVLKDHKETTQQNLNLWKEVSIENGFSSAQSIYTYSSRGLLRITDLALSPIQSICVLFVKKNCVLKKKFSLTWPAIIIYLDTQLVLKILFLQFQNSKKVIFLFLKRELYPNEFVVITTGLCGSFEKKLKAILSKQVFFSRVYEN